AVEAAAPAAGLPRVPDVRRQGCRRDLRQGHLPAQRRWHERRRAVARHPHTRRDSDDADQRVRAASAQSPLARGPAGGSGYAPCGRLLPVRPLPPMRSTAPLTYVTLRRDYSPGAFRQVEEMARVAAREHLPLECYWIRGAHSPHPKPPHVHVIDVENRLGGGIGLRLAQYKAVADLARERPHILLRYPTADPALLALMSQRRLITEHHSKEIEELERDQPGRAALERWLGASILRRTRGLVAVTRDILDYERARAGGRPGLVAGNAIDIHGDGPAWLQSPWRRHAPLRLLFVASTVHPWHGLDLVLDALARTDPKRYDLHVCGAAAPEYERQARAGGVTATFHGRLAPDALWPRYEWADAGISAFGLHRKGLASASSL